MVRRRDDDGVHQSLMYVQPAQTTAPSANPETLFVVSGDYRYGVVWQLTVAFSYMNEGVAAWQTTVQTAFHSACPECTVGCCVHGVHSIW